jgi:hypothetical protein
MNATIFYGEKQKILGTGKGPLVAVQVEREL